MNELTESGLAPADVEMIAAFLEGRLSEGERDAFLERLNRDEALYEVFVETVRFRDETEGGRGEVVVHPAVRWVQKRWAVPGALAALLAAVIAVPLLRGGGALPVATLTRALAEGGGLGGLEEGWFEQGWSVTRGFGSGRGDEERAFRIGVRVVDLDLALRLGRPADAEVLTYRIERLLDPFELPELLQAEYRGVRESIAAEGSLQVALGLSENADPLFAPSFPEHEWAYEFGKWAEAGRLAAGSDNRKLLRSRPFRRTFGDVAERVDREWDFSVATALETVDEVLDRPRDEMDLERLREAFETIINAA